MAHWCLRQVDYDRLDFLTKPSLDWKFKKPDEEVENRATKGGKEETKPLKPSPQIGDGDSLPGAVARRHRHLPRPCGVTKQQRMLRALETGSVAEEKEGGHGEGEVHWAVAELRTVIIDKTRHREIPKLVATWPLHTLRLQDVLLAEECDRMFSSPDELWTFLFQGLVLLSPISHLQKLDLSGFVPSAGLLYTVLQLVPLLTLTEDNLDVEVILGVVTKQLDLSSYEDGLVANLRTFLDSILQHKVFHRGRQIKLPCSELVIVVDFFPLSAGGLPFLSYLVAVGLEHLTGVRVHQITTVFSYSTALPGAHMATINPLLPLLITTRQTSKILLGLSADGIPENDITHFLSNLEKVSTCRDLQALGITNSHLILTQLTLRSKVVELFGSYHVLKRLDLTGSQLSGELASLLESLHKPLEYLNLSYCCVQLSDLESLCESKHCKSLRDLDLSYIYSFECQDCKDRATKQGIDTADRDGADSGFYGNDSPSSQSSRVASPRSTEKMTAQTEDLNIWTFWKFLSENTESMAPPADTMHEQDRILVGHLLTKIGHFSNTVVLEMSNNCYNFRVSHDTLQELLLGMTSIVGLKHLAIEGFPLWDDDIYAVAEQSVAMATVHSLALTRSQDAPRMQMRDKFTFWKRMHHIRSGKMLRMSIENFAEDEVDSIPDSEDFEDMQSFSSFSTPRY